MDKIRLFKTNPTEDVTVEAPYLVAVNNKMYSPSSEAVTAVTISTDGSVTEQKEEEQTDYVNLGLPSGTLWAKCNLGATKPEEYGLYFQWGDTVGYKSGEAEKHRTWSTAPFNNDSSEYDSSYFESVSGTVCPNGILASEYDAAYQASNGVMRMPTKDEFQELIDNTDRLFTQVNGIDGYKFTSTEDSSKFIFIPLAGHYDPWYSPSSEPQIDGLIWTSNLINDKPRYAYSCSLDDRNYVEINNHTRERFYGCSIRGVMSKN